LSPRAPESEQFLQVRLRQFFAGAFARDHAPQGWEVSVEKDRVEVQAGELARVPILIRAATPGRGAYAIKVINTASRDEWVVTEPIEIVAV